jgi:hypothetical protein
LTNGATVTKTCYNDQSGLPANIVNCTDANVVLIRGIGTLGSVRRAFELELNP